jgi:peptidoglycan/xylan/chitin deacetylase (PgdA/CDA1 family)
VLDGAIGRGAKGLGGEPSAWEVYAAKEEALGRLGEEILVEIEARGKSFVAPTPKLVDFLDATGAKGGLEEGDLLAFDDLARDILESLERIEDEDTDALERRVQSLVERIDEVRSALDAEAIAAESIPPGAKGLPGRPRWESYLESIRGAAPIDPEGDVPSGAKGIAPGLPQGEAKAASSAVTGRGLPPKTFVLTFDDGPHGTRTDAILAILQQAKAPACFFQVGQRIGSVSANGVVELGRGAGVSGRLLAAGYPIANHSFTHADLRKLAEPARLSEIDRTDALLERVGAQGVVLFRPPYGSYDGRLAQVISDRNSKNVLWNVDSEDWRDPLPSSIASRVVRDARAQGRGIILFHDIHDRTVKALPTVLASLESEGFVFGTCAQATP